MSISREQVLTCLSAVAQVLAENKDYLTELDAAIGDADHGINMDRGFKAVVGRLPGLQDKDIGSILKAVGTALVSTVGGAAGPLYGTLFLRMGAAMADKSELTAADVLAMLDAGVRGVRERGKANRGEKTMVDALEPAVEALRDGLARQLEFGEALQDAVAAAEAGMLSTVPMKALKGRASYLGERSIGHQDPGATSSYLILKTVQRCLSAGR